MLTQYSRFFCFRQSQEVVGLKNKGSFVLLAVTLLFVGFTLGLLLGQNGLRSSDVSVSYIRTPASSEESTGQAQGMLIVDINTADQTLLTSLPGVGDYLARRILEYRQENGPFTSVEDLLNVSGIGEKKLEEIRPWVKIGG